MSIIFTTFIIWAIVFFISGFIYMYRDCPIEEGEKPHSKAYVIKLIIPFYNIYYAITAKDAYKL